MTKKKGLFSKLTQKDINFLGGVLALSILIAIIMLSIPSVNIKFKCDIDNIEYTELEDAECWNSQFSDNYCPMPKDIDCELDGKVSLLTLLALA